MIRRGFVITMILALQACAMNGSRETLASLDDVKLELKDEKIEGSLEKAMQSYQRFLQETPETAMTPEAIRRLADLKIEKEYSSALPETDDEKAPPSTEKSVVKSSEKNTADNKTAIKQDNSHGIADISRESQQAFEQRASAKEKITKIASSEKAALPGTAEEQQAAGAMEAIELYKNLLKKYPLYERNDQVLYQLSRAYEETGQIEKAMKVLNKLVKQYPQSRHIDEAQFRRAEYFFTRKKFLDAEEAYQAVLNFGAGSAFYELALYKQGWAYFKQELYEDALKDFIALLDYKLSIGFDFEQTENKIEKKRIEDTYRVISLSFSYLGGAKAIVEFFEKLGPRSYEASIYSHLGEYYLSKRRYADAAQSYISYVERNPLNKVSPYFNMRVIDIYLQGGFPKLVVDAKKEFSTTYGLNGSYWSFFDINDYPDVLAFLKSNLIDLANHYHALYQKPRLRKYKKENYKEAIHWYREFLLSFPEDKLSPGMNFQLAELLLENKDYRDAALEYEKTAYNYPAHEKSSAAGYATVFAYRKYLKKAPQAERAVIKREIIRSSLKFAETFPKHKEAAVVLTAAVDDLYAIKDYELAIKTGWKVIKQYPNAKPALRRSAWLVIAHASFDTTQYAEAEKAYMQVLKLTPAKDKRRKSLNENLAASIYKQGDQARILKDYKKAAEHFLRVARLAPGSKIIPTAEYDGAAALIVLKEWKPAITVLQNFRKHFKGHKLQPQVTRKLAVVYKEDGQYLQAAAEFERIEQETKNRDIQREALLEAAELYEKAGDEDRALLVLNRFVRKFPRPLEFVLETRWKMAKIYKKKGRKKARKKQLTAIVRGHREGGKQRTDRTRYLAAVADLELTEFRKNRFNSVKLVKPFKKNLTQKQRYLKQAIHAYTQLVDYQVGEVTAAATYEIAEMYYIFSRDLMSSERPTNLNELELEQYELALEEQAYPFEEKAIRVHEKNIELLREGIYNQWIDKSIAKLAVLLPARYNKHEQPSDFVRLLSPLLEQQTETVVEPLKDAVKEGAVEEKTVDKKPLEEQP